MEQEEGASQIDESEENAEIYENWAQEVSIPDLMVLFLKIAVALLPFGIFAFFVAAIIAANSR